MDGCIYETKSAMETANYLKTDLQNGLSNEEAKNRLLKYGENKLQEKKRKSWLRIFVEQLNNPMIYVLFAATLITIAVSIYDSIQWVNSGKTFDFFKTGDWPDVIIILSVIIINGAIGTVQEIKATSSLEALKKLSSPESLVIRQGKKIRIKSSELVLGDLVIIEEGDTIGADLRLVESHNLKVSEASLTGESTQIEKDASIVLSNKVGVSDRINQVFMSTPVTYGRGKGIVINTGMGTQIGRIASSLNHTNEEMTPLQKTLAKLSKTLGIISLAVVVIVFIVDLIWIYVDGKGGDVESYIEALLSSISLAVAAIPEGLPAVVTIVLSIGVQKMVKANTIVRKLPSVETLGAVSIVCSDKTGTLTQNKMSVVEAYFDGRNIKSGQFSLEKSEDFLFLGKGLTLCNNAGIEKGIFGDPTEIALIVFAQKMNIHKEDLEKQCPRIDELPFDSNRKMMTTKNKNQSKIINFTKGALDSILKRTTKILDNGIIRDIEKEDFDNIYMMNKEYSNKALRVLALAYNEEKEITETNLIFVGLVAMVDPPREEAKPAVKKLKEAGILTVMITGDHIDTAFAIAKELGIADSSKQCLRGVDIDNMTIEELQKACLNTRVFARVSPENKAQIVKAFQNNGNIIAMTGDGVNDAPSLKAADIGIAMGISGTDVAKSAADMVLIDDNFASIEKAVEEGRGIFEDIKKTVLFLLSSNIAEIITMLILICIGMPMPLVAIHLLWVNLITDSLPSVALGMDPKDKDIMNRKPRNPKEGIFAKGGYRKVFGYGTCITLSVIIAYFSVGWLNGMHSLREIKRLYETNAFMLQEAQTMAFTSLAFSELFHMLGISSFDESVFKIVEKKNWMILISFLLGALLQFAVVEIPLARNVFSTSNLTWTEWGINTLLSLFPLVVHEIVILINTIKKHFGK